MRALGFLFDSPDFRRRRVVRLAAFYAVPGEGLGPSIPYGHDILSVARIPVPPPGLNILSLYLFHDGLDLYAWAVSYDN